MKNEEWEGLVIDFYQNDPLPSSFVLYVQDMENRKNHLQGTLKMGGQPEKHH